VFVKLEGAELNRIDHVTCSAAPLPPCKEKGGAEFRWATSSQEQVEEGLVGEHGLGLAVRLVARHAVVSMCVVESRGGSSLIYSQRVFLTIGYAVQY